MSVNSQVPGAADWGIYVPRMILSFSQNPGHWEVEKVYSADVGNSKVLTRYLRGLRNQERLEERDATAVRVMGNEWSGKIGIPVLATLGNCPFCVL